MIIWILKLNIFVWDEAYDTQTGFLMIIFFKIVFLNLQKLV